MSTFVLENWPDSVRESGLLARDPAQSVDDRVGALQQLRDALDGDWFTDEQLRDEVLSFCASLVAVEGQNDKIENAAMIALAPTIKHLAACVAARSPDQAAHDIRADGESTIWKGLKNGTFNLEKGVFAAWCFTVLLNDLNTRRRKTGRRTPGNAGTLALEPPDKASCAIDGVRDWKEFLDAPLPDCDRAFFASLPPKKRLVLLCLSGLCFKIRRETYWQEWVDDANGTTPFPPEDFIDLATNRERQACLAEALALSPAAVTQIWHRSVKSGLWSTLACHRSLK